MHFKGIFRLGLVLVASVALVSASGAGTSAAKSGTRIDVSTRASIVHYLRSIHVNPKGVVIQRGLRNYAGPSCPGRAWRCARTQHAVVQIARPGGMNRFLCRTARCAVLQVAAAASRNSATCIKTTGLGASCSITQSNSAGNTALIWEDAGKLTGLTQTAVYSASIVQQSGSGANLACVHQSIFIDGSTTNTRSTGATVTLEAHQSIFVKQDSTSGSNTAENAANPSTGVYTCASTAVSQDQKLTSTATSRGLITQNENAAQTLCPDGVSGDYFNMCLDIEQNQSTGFKGVATGTNNATFAQTNTLSAIANSPAAVNQTQSSHTLTGDGGLVGTINQDSMGVSTAVATQSETQCEDAATANLTSCDTADPDASEAPSSLTQTQYGPEGIWKARNNRHRGRQFHSTFKGLGTATQTGNTGDTFTITQSSKQDNDQGSGSTQKNTVKGDCSTPGNCTDNQTVTVNGQTSTNTQSGQNVNAQTTCSGSACTTTTVGSGDIFVSVGDGLIQEWTPSGTFVRTLDTGKGSGKLTAGLAFDAFGRLYSADFSSQDVSQFNSDGTLAGSFGSGYNLDPESIVFDSSGNAYVGQADGSGQVLEFNSSGTQVASFSPAAEDRGTDWIDLAPDGCTLYYTSEGTLVKRFDVCTPTQLADFADLSSVPDPGTAYAIKLLPAGGALVADTDSIVRLDSSGTVVQQYGVGESAGGAWFSLALDPSGGSFWAGDVITGDVKEFALSSGLVLASFNTGGAADDAAGGLAIEP